MSYNLACAELEDIPDSNIEELSQSQSVVSDPDLDFVPPSSSSLNDLTGSSNSDGTQSDNNQVCGHIFRHYLFPLSRVVPIQVSVIIRCNAEARYRNRYRHSAEAIY